MRAAIAEIDARDSARVVVVDVDGRLAGIVTDGDLRRTIFRSDLDGLRGGAHERKPTTAPPTLLAKALEIQESRKSRR